jgi:hypothetical protein
MCKKKHYDDDNGESFANMNVEGMPGYVPEQTRRKQKAISDLNLSKKEKWAMIKGAYLAFLPVFLIIIGGFVLVILLLYLWY